MYNVMLVDDEINNLELMSIVIPWQQLGFCVTHCMTDARQALEVLKHKHVDVVFVDMHMPHLSGLELIEKIRAFNAQICIVILTAHSNFEYAQKAIRFSVHEYILKPVTRKEIYEVAQKIAEQLQQQNSLWSEQLRQQLAHDVLTGTLQCLCAERCPPLDVFSKEEAACTVRLFGEKTFLAEIEPALDAQKDFLWVYVPLPCKTVALLTPVPANPQETLLFEGRQLLFQDSLQNETYREKIAKLARCVQSVFYACVKPQQENASIPHFSALRTVMRDSFIGAQAQPLENAVAAYFEMFLRVQPTCADAKLFWFEVCVLLRSQMIEVYKNEKSIEPLQYLEFEQAPTLQALRVLVNDVTRRIFDAVSKISQESDTRTVVCRRSMAYLAEHYADKDLSAEKVAEIMGLSKNYFLKIFNTTQTQSFWAAVTHLRMCRAKELLLATDKKIAEIGAAVGYESEFHFSQKFKKEIGMSPHHFRMAQKE